MNQPRQAKLLYRVDLQPVGRRIQIKPGSTLLDATRTAGVELVALCGGESWCHSCIVHLLKGQLSEITPTEEDALRPEQLDSGFRLACQAIPLSDVSIDIPPESLTAQQRLQIEGLEDELQPDPSIKTVDVTLSPPTLHDLRSDAGRLQEAVADTIGVRPILPYPLLQDLSGLLREQNWSVRMGLRDLGDEARIPEVVIVVPTNLPLLGLAVDIGTTKLAAYLVDLFTGQTLAKAGAMNPQIPYGEDIISRIAYTVEHFDGRATLQTLVADAINDLVSTLCIDSGMSRTQIAEAVIVGNTAMHHLFAGLPVQQLALAPYVTAISEPLELYARDVNLELAPAARVYLPPNIAGYVGADHVAMAVATGAWETDRTLVALDIGTNTEVTVARGGRIWSCSCASGPAFEGAHIKDGMRAAPGAIERMQIVGGKAHLKTIANQPPVGICGSGILDAISELLKAGIIDRKGSLQVGAPGVSVDNGLARYTIAPAEITGHGRPVVITRKDINEIQLAKAAIRSGIEILLQEANATYTDIEEFIVAGAFGTYLDINSSIRTGLFPPLPIERFKQVGNAAGAGARKILVSAERRRAAVIASRRVKYIELTNHQNFQNTYVKAMYF